jgi:hypothetical protein
VDGPIILVILYWVVFVIWRKLPCITHVDIYRTLPALVTTVCLKVIPHVHVEYVVKIGVKLSLTKVHFVGLHYVTILQCAVQTDIEQLTVT